MNSVDKMSSLVNRKPDFKWKEPVNTWLWLWINLTPALSDGDRQILKAGQPMAEMTGLCPLRDLALKEYSGELNKDTECSPLSLLVCVCRHVHTHTHTPQIELCFPSLYQCLPLPVRFHVKLATIPGRNFPMSMSYISLVPLETHTIIMYIINLPQTKG